MEDKIFSINDAGFEQFALDLFRFQYRNNPVYQSWIDLIGREADQIRHIWDIPFLPIGFFKTMEVCSTSFTPQTIFKSSGTSESGASYHLVKKTDLYLKSFTTTFKQFYGVPHQYCILGLLPSYLERSDSSLVVMVSELIKQSGHPMSGFYLHDHAKLKETLIELERNNMPSILIGVTFALLDFAEQFGFPLKSAIIMETGGMKGRRKELSREEVHEILKQRFHINAVHAEYGMTELLSQAYSKGDGKFKSPPWMKIILRDENDPFLLYKPDESVNKTGVINIIDLANIYSCSFIATDDLGKIEGDFFTVEGRLDNSDIRGCNLLVPQPF